jgi:hypothetical protein
MKKMTGAIAAFVMAFGGVLAMSEPASAVPPGNCDTTTDYGVFDSRNDSSYVGGTWVNCGGTWDEVYINVNNATDSNCAWVGPYTSKHLQYDPLFWGPGSHGRSFGRCY